MERFRGENLLGAISSFRGDIPSGETLPAPFLSRSTVSRPPPTLYYEIIDFCYKYRSRRADYSPLRASWHRRAMAILSASFSRERQRRCDDD